MSLCPNPTPMLPVTTIIENLAGATLPCPPRRDKTIPMLHHPMRAVQDTTTPMLATPATTTPMLATNNYYQARPDRVEAKKNRPRMPKQTRPDTARRPQGLQKIRDKQRRERRQLDHDQKTVELSIRHEAPDLARNRALRAKQTQL